MSAQADSGTRFTRMWIELNKKENSLRLKWFRRNEQRLVESIDADLLCTVPQNEVDEVVKQRLDEQRNLKRFPKHGVEDPPPGEVRYDLIIKPMKHVPSAINDLLYNNPIGEGRKAYLKQRIKVAPEDRFYYPEVTSYDYGWKMRDHAKTRTASKFGRVQILKETFYRRNGLHRDPDHYTIPARLSPNICNCHD